ncbi:MAG: LLM class flavin-dependent oxidoreductase, partial [Alphaproteobacteria bacterium]|nr:LLM class flavin-dependent oxidoreductase [Alphaproteobacteria bacterium]
GTVMLAFHMLCHRDGKRAAEIAREPLNRYLRSLVEAASDWTGGLSSKDYPNYDKIIEALSRETFESQVAKRAAWVGTPEELKRAIAEYEAQVGGFEIASMQVSFNTITVDQAESSMRLFAAEVMPHFGGATQAAQ